MIFSTDTARLVLAANGDEGGWVQLLVFVVVAVLYALGGLAKARRQKKEPLEDEDYPIAEPPTPRDIPSPPRSAGTETRVSRPEHTPIAPPVAEQPPQPDIGRQAWLDYMSAQAATQQSDEPRSAAPDRSSRIKKRLRVGSDETQAVSVDLSDPDLVRNAIVHYEIFAPCVALRPPREVS